MSRGLSKCGRHAGGLSPYDCLVALQTKYGCKKNTVTYVEHLSGSCAANEPFPGYKIACLDPGDANSRRQQESNKVVHVTKQSGGQTGMYSVYMAGQSALTACL